MNFRFLLLCFIIVVVDQTAFAAEPQFAKTWQLTEMEPSSWAKDEALVRPELLTQWRDYDAPLVPPGINKTIWLRNTLPDLPNEPYVLYVRNGLEDIAVYIDGQLKYSFGEFTKPWNATSPQRWHVIPVTKADSGKPLLIRTHYALSYVVRTLYPTLRPQAVIAPGHINDSFLLCIIAGAAGLMGFLSLSVAIARRHFDLFMYFGLMGLALSSWTLFNQDSIIKPYLGIPTKAWTYFDLIGLYVSEIGLICFLSDIPQHSKSLMIWVRRVNWAMVAIVAAVSGAQVLNAWYTLPLLHVVVFPSIVLIVGAIGWSALKGNAESRVIVMGAGIIGISVVHDVVRYLNLFPSPVKSMIPVGGMLLFATMVMVLARRYKSEREAALANIRELNRQLEKQVEVEEALVAEKTQEISSILEHIQQGIFMLAGPDVRIQDEYSQYLEGLLETTEISDRTFEESFLGRCDLSSDQKSRLMASLKASLGEQLIGFEINAGNFLDEIRIRAKTGEKIVELSWAAMVHESGEVHKILVTARDVTGMRELEQVAARNQEEMRIFQALLESSPRQFSGFLKSSSRLLSGIQDVLANHRADRRERLKSIFRDLHTIKGNARTFQLDDLASVIHDAENQVQHLMNQSTTPLQHLLLPLIEEAKAKLRIFADIFQNRLHLDTSIDQVRVDKAAVEQLFFDRVQATAAETLEGFERLLLPKVFTPASELFHSATTNLGKLAQDLGKPRPTVICESGKIYFTATATEVLSDVLGHLLRNSLDHGIEAPDERQRRQKPEQGHIQISCNDKGTEVQIAVADDGRGLDLQLLLGRAREQGILKPKNDLNEQTIEELLFLSGFSTKDQVSLVSGRGVGLDAVRASLATLGGKIKLQMLSPLAVDGFWQFGFTLVLPASCYMTAAFDEDRYAGAVSA